MSDTLINQHKGIRARNAAFALSVVIGLATAALPAVAAGDSTLRLGQTNLPQIGQGVATYLWFDVYRATLYAPKGIPAADILSRNVPKILALRYNHSVTATDIKKASWQTLKKQMSDKQLAALRPALSALLSSMKDVKAGDQYSLIWQPQNATQPAVLKLALNDKVLFKSKDAALAKAYFGIWLGKPPLSAPLKADLLAGLHDH